ncbi:MAG: TldD/PmbA family protein [Clostridia bacterium]|nr:TldD/PmbA family protein [Clostridia bacterium]
MDVETFIRQLFDRAASEGFEACEADLRMEESFTVGVREGEISDYSVSSSQGLGFRGLVNGKMGYASTQVFDDEAVSLLVTGAKENASLIENADTQFIYQGDEAYPQVDIYNSAVDALTSSEKIELAKSLEKACLSIDPRVTRCQQVQLMTESSSRRLVNTRGLDVAYRGNTIGVYASVLAHEGADVTRGSSFALLRDPAQLDIEHVAREAVEEAIHYLQASQVSSGEYPVVLRYDVASALLNTFSEIFSADAAQKGMSLYKGREGEAIAAPCVSIVDDPLNPESPDAAPFDGEGVATRRTDLVKDGVLKTLMHNLRTAGKQGVCTTANASKRSYDSPVGVGARGMYVVPGAESLDQLLKRCGQGVFITDVQGLHSGANQISGDFSLGAKGFTIENGAIGRPLSQITVAGNFYQLLRSVKAVGNELKFGFSRVASPDLLIDSLSIAGK